MLVQYLHKFSIKQKKYFYDILTCIIIWFTDFFLIQKAMIEKGEKMETEGQAFSNNPLPK